MAWSESGEGICRRRLTVADSCARGSQPNARGSHVKSLRLGIQGIGALLMNRYGAGVKG